ncbi:MAG TPA: hypothetical protein VFR90_10615 [Methylibium sp.]|uniref:hypothetical protein n=1 Tax=Methylibium sp. TaxID=2067992 RepID=UPI002DBC5326|nr:hypothetical protein [Methylibium sp.]HEU4459565.1 hypothetical protein [Methylibium sp.]
MRPETLSVLAGIKRRGLAALEDGVRAADAQRAEAEQAAEQRRREHAQKQAAEQAMRDRLAERTGAGRGFLPSEMIVLSTLVTDRSAETTQAQAAVEQSQRGVQAALDALVEARRVVKRANRRIEVIEERRDELLRTRADAAQDEQDEEAEESSTARLLRARAAPESP